MRRRENGRENEVEIVCDYVLTLILERAMLFPDRKTIDRAGGTGSRRMAMKDMNKQDESKSAFGALSRSRQSALKKSARRFIQENPGSADNSRFWRCLSARQITEA